MKIFIISLFLSPFALAVETELSAYEDYYTYDTIVEELSMDRPEESRQDLEKDYETVYFQVGAGFSQSILNIRGDGASDTVSMNGIEIRGAISLMSPLWLMEATLRNYNSAQGSRANYELREFELKVTNLTPVSRSLFYRVTSGLATRFLESNLETAENGNKSYNTPSLILGGGAGYNLNPRMAIVGDVAFKTSMIEDTIDKNVLDLTIRFDTRF